MKTMEEFAPIYGLQLNSARLAGLLHDAAKDLPPASWKAIVREGSIPICYPEENNYHLYLHGPVGAYFVHRELGVRDPEILDAIAMHTYCGDGPAFNAPLSWCLRFSDLLEPNRDWEAVRQLRAAVPRLRTAAYAGRLEEAAFLQTGMLVEWFEEAEMPVHPHIRRAHAEMGAHV